MLPRRSSVSASISWSSAEVRFSTCWASCRAGFRCSSSADPASPAAKASSNLPRATRPSEPRIGGRRSAHLARGPLEDVQAARIILLAEDDCALVKGDGEVADLVALVGGKAYRGDSERRGGLVAVPRDPGVLEGGSGWPGPRLPREPHPVLGDDVPVVFPAGQRPTGGGVGEVGGDAGDESGPFAVPPGPLMQDPQAHQAADRGVPESDRSGKGQGMPQVICLASPAARTRPAPAGLAATLSGRRSPHRACGTSTT